MFERVKKDLPDERKLSNQTAAVKPRVICWEQHGIWFVRAKYSYLHSLRV